MKIVEGLKKIKGQTAFGKNLLGDNKADSGLGRMLKAIKHKGKPEKGSNPPFA